MQLLSIKATIILILLDCTLASTFAQFLCTFWNSLDFFHDGAHVLFDASREEKKHQTFQVLHPYLFATVIPRN
ncbi:hypothetical protein ARMSODRAFT_136570 [Armillaria solidipes]|uniref:Secreted protein n=1 Tax=Armillaria solidipes TaxID=1076256 RepID=A0A2H3BL47_9AGAR|nr:hypothetical protein ARMSODRAFT_136570 [Armillaria solidipes]